MQRMSAFASLADWLKVQMQRNVALSCLPGLLETRMQVARPRQVKLVEPASNSFFFAVFRTMAVI